MTAGYIVTEVERLRVLMQRITHSIPQRIKEADECNDADRKGV